MLNLFFIKMKFFRYKFILSFGYFIVYIVCCEFNVVFEGYNLIMC